MILLVVFLAIVAFLLLLIFTAPDRPSTDSRSEGSEQMVVFALLLFASSLLAVLLSFVLVIGVKEYGVAGVTPPDDLLGFWLDNSMPMFFAVVPVITLATRRKYRRSRFVSSRDWRIIRRVEVFLILANLGLLAHSYVSNGAIGSHVQLWCNLADLMPAIHYGPVEWFCAGSGLVASTMGIIDSTRFA